MATRYSDLSETTFDPSRRYMVRKPFVVDGKQFSAGDVFDSKLTTTRRHRQLYEQRWISIDERPAATISAPTKEAAKVIAPAPRQDARTKPSRRHRAA